jgi:Tfp pilus assembly protein FimT
MQTKFIHRRQMHGNPATPLRAGNTRGFSAIELLLVVGVMLVIIAIAGVNMKSSLTLAKWRGEIGDLSGVFQTCRSQSIKNNATEALTFTTSNGLTVAYIFNYDNPFVNGVDTSNLVVNQDAQSVLSSQRQVWLFAHFKQAAVPTGTNPPPLTAGMMWGGSSTAAPTTPATNNICFNSRGIPCTCPADAGGNPIRPAYCTGITNGYAFYFMQDTQWAAVGVSPAGRIKTYFWNGSAWAN